MSERFGPDFELKLKREFQAEVWSVILLLMFGLDFEVDAWLRF